MRCQARRVRASLSRTFWLVLALTLGFASAANADTFQPGAEITFTQVAWGDETTPSVPAILLRANLGTIFPPC